LAAKDENVSREEAEDDRRGRVVRVQVVAIRRHRLVEAMMIVIAALLANALRKNAGRAAAKEQKSGALGGGLSRQLALAGVGVKRFLLSRTTSCVHDSHVAFIS
jgi:hypothetical protein